MKDSTSFILLLFALVWCGGMLFIDSLGVPGVMRQIRSTSFPIAHGAITRSEVTQMRRPKSKMRYRWKIEYRYEVDGQAFTGDQVKFGTMTFGNGRGQSQRYVAEYPVGKEVAVHYDPAAPGEALLQPGFLPDHLLLALVVTPHHLIGIGLLVAALSPLYRRLRGQPAPLVLHPVDDLRMSVRMPWLAAWAVGMYALGGAAIVGVLLGAFALSVMPSMAPIVAIWALVLGCAVFFARRRQAQFDAGLADLTIDAGARTVTLPIGEGRKERVVFPFADISAVSLTTRTVRSTRSRGGGGTRTTTRQYYDLSLVGPSESRHRLISEARPERLRAIGEALHKTVGWPFDQAPGTS